MFNRNEIKAGTSRASRRTNRRALLRSTKGAQLLEFVLVFPILIGLAMGIVDLAGAYKLNQKLTNAAREGARIGIGQPKIDLTQANPLTVQAIRASVLNYLQNDGVDTSAFSATPTAGTGVGEFTYASTDGSATSLVIERDYIFTGPNGVVQNTRITLNYPYTWTFAQILRGMLGCPASDPNCFTGSITLSTTATMKNL